MKILVVDDDSLAAAMAGAVLEGAGYDVVLAENAVEAMQQLDADGAIDVIVSDMNMPLASGVELFRELRAGGNTLPFVLLTGDDPAALAAQEPRLDACLLKDGSLDETLPQVVAEMLARR